MKTHLLAFGDHLPDPVTGASTSVAERHRAVIESGVAAEAAGFDGFNVGEHHAGPFVSVSPPILLAAVAARTSTLRLGTGVTLLANIDPLRAAEDYAVLDLVSNGRAEICVGRGNLFAKTYELFGQKLDDSRQLFEENVELLLRLWTEESVTWSGLSRPDLNNVTLQPRPIQRPHPPVSIGGGGSVETAHLAARLGLPLVLPSGFSTPDRFVPVVAAYKEAFQSVNGSQPKIGACWHVNVARTSQQARERWKPRFVAYHDWFGALVQSQTPGFKSEPLDFEWTVTHGSAVVGSPAEVTERLLFLSDTLGVDTNLLYLDSGGAPLGEVLDMIEILGHEVLPKLK
ncbi:LLM class flavin-dependent oxidoreductase [Streptomyces sp. NPDC051219]|uniref:LLM class flavin-dependent oxidoreductase n=1 Tax=Streptomyces sp. NPDC051219 TaxID=3155283 RepID=UPI0034136D61